MFSSEGLHLLELLLLLPAFESLNSAIFCSHSAFKSLSRRSNSSWILTPASFFTCCAISTACPLSLSPMAFSMLANLLLKLSANWVNVLPIFTSSSPTLCCSASTLALRALISLSVFKNSCSAVYLTFLVALATNLMSSCTSLNIISMPRLCSLGLVLLSRLF